MNQTKRRSILCPNCRKLISGDEPKCPYCNMIRPGSVLRNNSIMRGLGDSRSVALVVVWVNVGMYLISLFLSGRYVGFSMNPLDALSPSRGILELLGGTGRLPIDRLNAWWTIVSANYLHGSILHILFNMLMFWQLVPLVSREYGVYRMFSIYTIGGAAGFIVSYFAGIQFTIGASAAVCSLVGSLLYFGKSRGGVYGQTVYKQILGWVISLFIFGFIVPGINNWAHAGGIAGGIALGYLLGYEDRKKEASFDKTFAYICMAITVMILFWAVARSVFVLLLYSMHT